MTQVLWAFHYDDSEIPVSQVYATVQNQFHPLQVPRDCCPLGQQMSLVTYGGSLYT